MPLISLTRLRLASVRHLPGFAWYAWRSASQARRSPGFIEMRLLPDRGLTFWTATAWADLDAINRYRSAGAHRSAMPLLARWCSEGSVTRWEGGVETMDDWPAAHARMVGEGKPSAVRRPSPEQATLSYPPPVVRARATLRITARS